MDPQQWMAFGRGASGDSKEPQISTLLQILPHPLAKKRRGLTQYDLALIQLETPFEFGGNTKHICIADKPPRAKGQMCVVAGWTDDPKTGLPFHQYLDYIPVPYFETQSCNSTQHYNGQLQADALCTGTRTDKNACRVSIAKSYKLIPN